MRTPPLRDIPPRAAAAVLALVLLATVVTGREQNAAPEVVAAIAPPAATPERIDLQLPMRPRAERSANDLFRGHAETAPPPPPAVAAVAPTQPLAAPSLPFRYLGRMTKADRQLVYLLKGEEMIVAEAGQALDAAYRVESISAASMQFVYLPLGVRQSLSIPAGP